MAYAQVTDQFDNVVDSFFNFIDYIEQTTFGIACDAQANFKVGLFPAVKTVDLTRCLGSSHET